MRRSEADRAKAISDSALAASLGGELRQPPAYRLVVVEGELRPTWPTWPDLSGRRGSPVTCPRA